MKDGFIEVGSKLVILSLLFSYLMKILVIYPTSLVWFKNMVPKHAFNFWVANLNRLPLNERLHQWGLMDSGLCTLCSTDQESRDHLFLTAGSQQTFGTTLNRNLAPQGFELHHGMTWLNGFFRGLDQQGEDISGKLCAKQQSTLFGRREMTGNMGGLLQRPLSYSTKLTGQRRTLY